MEIKKVLLLKYGEISLRKGNRSLYERRLINTIRRNIGSCGESSIHVIREQGRILIEDIRGDINERVVLPKVKSIFGITAFCFCMKSSLNPADAGVLDDLKKIALAFMIEKHSGKNISFKVETKRGDKRFQMTSREISSEVGGYILENMPDLHVDVHNPDIILWIELRNHCYVYTKSIPGENGLPYGSSGKAVLLLSGGIDSPVAGYLTARRGVEIVPVYFHSPPYTSDRVVDKVSDLSKVMASYTGDIPLFVVPFTDVQLYLHERVKPAKLTVFLKRAMLAIASALAAREHAQCLIVGDSIGQVASQTLHSIAAIDSAAGHIPVIRPLAALDKQQIINQAIKIGTYDISIRPYEDCCTVFVAEHPECHPMASVIEGIEARLAELPGLLSAALERTERMLIQAGSDE